jgi:AraC-like DNA-binding protein
LCDYRQELRLRKGLFLLEESGLEIGDIAVQVGFASHSHFTSAFHRRFGINPSEFLRWKSSKLVRDESLLIFSRQGQAVTASRIFVGATGT